MIQRNNPWNSYRQVALQTASPGQLVLMLFDGAVNFLEKGLLGFAFDDPLEFNRTVNNNILRAQAIINELNVALNMEQGGEIAVHMRQLYLYFDRQLQDSNLRKSPDGIQDVIRRLTILRDAWSEMIQKNGGHHPMTSVSSAA